MIIFWSFTSNTPRLLGVLSMIAQSWYCLSLGSFGRLLTTRYTLADVESQNMLADDFGAFAVPCMFTTIVSFFIISSRSWMIRCTILAVESLSFSALALSAAIVSLSLMVLLVYQTLTASRIIAAAAT